jgi:hypothetical protein
MSKVVCGCAVLVALCAAQASASEDESEIWSALNGTWAIDAGTDPGTKKSAGLPDRITFEGVKAFRMGRALYLFIPTVALYDASGKFFKARQRWSSRILQVKKPLAPETDYRVVEIKLRTIGSRPSYARTLRISQLPSQRLVVSMIVEADFNYCDPMRMVDGPVTCEFVPYSKSYDR